MATFSRGVRLRRGGAVLAAILSTSAWAADVSPSEPAAPPTPAAEAKPAPEVIGFAVGGRLQSDYNFRGISQSNHDGSPQSYFETRLFDNSVYFGIAQYKVDLPTRPTMEMDLTAGIRPTFGPLALDLGIIYYNYPGERRLVGPDGTIFTVANTDFAEAAARATWTVNDNLTLGANVFHEGNWLGTHANGTYSSGTFKYTLPKDAFGFLPEGFALSGEFGHYSLGTTSPQLGRVKLPSYNYGNVGLSYTYKNVTLDLRYHNTDLNKRECFTLTTDPRGIVTGSGRSNWCGQAIVGTISFDITTKDPGLLADLGRGSAAATKK